MFSRLPLIYTYNHRVVNHIALSILQSCHVYMRAYFLLEGFQSVWIKFDGLQESRKLLSSCSRPVLHGLEGVGHYHSGKFLEI